MNTTIGFEVTHTSSKFKVSDLRCGQSSQTAEDGAGDDDGGGGADGVDDGSHGNG